jgi:hypothetical protein
MSVCVCEQNCCWIQGLVPFPAPPYIPKIPKPPYYISTPVNGSEVPNTMAINISNISISYVSARKFPPVP